MSQPSAVKNGSRNRRRPVLWPHSARSCSSLQSGDWKTLRLRTASDAARSGQALRLLSKRSTRRSRASGAVAIEYQLRLGTRAEIAGKGQSHATRAQGTVPAISVMSRVSVVSRASTRRSRASGAGVPIWVQDTDSARYVKEPDRGLAEALAGSASSRRFSWSLPATARTETER
jgi:hypothetical protein